MHNVNQGMHDALKVPITIVNETHIDSVLPVGWVSRSINLDMQY